MIDWFLSSGQIAMIDKLFTPDDDDLFGDLDDDGQ